MADNNPDIINDIKKGLSDINSKISDLNGEISKKEKACESLVAFKRQVVATQENFNGLTGSQNSHLNSLLSSSDDCHSAKVYSEGMNKTLTSFGTRIVGLALVGFIAKIDFRIGLYKTEIAAAKSTIGQLSNQIDHMQSEMERLLGQGD